MTRSIAAMLAAILLPSGVGAQEDAAKKSLEEAAELLKGVGKAEVTYFRVDPASEGKGKADGLRGWVVLERKPLKEAKTVEEVRSILTDPKTYAQFGAKCFLPGMGFRFKGEAKSFDLVICLKCSWIYAYTGAEDTLTYSSWALSEAGVKRLFAFYQAQGEAPAKK